MLRTSETLLGPEPAPSAYLEGYRVLRSSILARGQKDEFRSVLVTSPVQGEGKTTVTLNLGVMLALIEKQTVLVDAAFDGAGFSTALELADRPGLTDVFAGDLQLSEALMESEIPSLLLLPVGTRTRQGPELALSAGHRSMRTVIEELTGSADFVLTDTTAVTGYGTALSLAGLHDIVLLVTLARSQATRVRRSIDDIRDAGGELGGVVVNDVLPSDSPVYQAYYG